MIDRNTRRRVLDRLLAQGGIVDASGRTASILRSDIGYLAASTRFAQLLASMERAGEIRREIRGKRTYRITVGPNADLEDLSIAERSETSAEGDGASPSAEEADGPVSRSDDIDYDELASAVLRSTAGALLDQSGSLEGGVRPMSSGRAQRRIVSLEPHLAELERAVARANAERADLVAQNAELRGQLEAATRTIDTLKAQLERRDRAAGARSVSSDSQPHRHSPRR